MNVTLLLVGVACVAGAIVGGGVKIANNELPVVKSVPRQLLLAILGIGVIVAGIGVLGIGAASPSGGNSGKSPGSPVTFPPFTFPSEPNPAIKLSPATGPPGTSVTVSGSGFQPRETIRIDFSTEQLSELKADANGGFGSTVVQIPADWQFKGQTYIIASGDSSSASTEEPFQVT